MTTATDHLKVVLTLDNGSFTTTVSQSKKKLAEFEVQADKVAKSMNKIGNGGGALRTFRDWTLVVGGLPFALHNAANALFGWQMAIVNANAELERSSLLLANFSNATSRTERLKDGRQQIAWLIEEASKAPFSLNAMTDAFVKLKVGGIEPTKQSFRALIDGVAAFGGTEQQLHRASIAIQQMAGKGVISMEELRQQLGEAVPTAMQTMAVSLNMSMQEMVKAISLGQVRAKPALQYFFRELARENMGAAALMMDSWNGVLARLKTDLIVAAKTIGDSGFFDAVKELGRDLSKYLNSGEFKQFAKDVADILKAVAQSASFLLSIIANNINILTKFFMVMTGWKVIKSIFGSVAQSIKDLKPDLSAINTAFDKTIRSLETKKRQTALVSAETKRLTEAYRQQQRAIRGVADAKIVVSRATSAEFKAQAQANLPRMIEQQRKAAESTKAFGTALQYAKGIAGVFGGFIGGALITAIISYAWEILDAHRKTNAFFDDVNKNMNKALADGTKKELDSINAKIKVTEENLTKALELYEKTKATGSYVQVQSLARGKTISTTITEAEAKKRLDEIKAQAYREKSFQVELSKKLNSEIAKEDFKNWQAAQQAKTEAVLAAYSLQSEKLNQQITEKMPAEQRAVINEQLNAVREATGKELAGIIDAQLNAIKNDTSKSKEYVNAYVLMLQELKDSYSQYRAETVDKNELLGGGTSDKESKAQRKELLDYLDRLKIGVARTTAVIEEQGPAMAALTAWLEGKEFNGENAKLVIELKKAAKAFDEIKAKQASLDALQTILGQNTVTQKRWRAELTKDADTLADLGFRTNEFQTKWSVLEEQIRSSEEWQKLGTGIEEAQKALEGMSRTASQFDRDSVLQQMEVQTTELTRAFMTQGDVADLEFDRSRRAIDAFLKKIQELGPLTTQQQLIIDNYKKALEEDRDAKAGTFLSKVKRDLVALGDMSTWTDLAINSIDKVSDAFVDMAMTGKKSFSDLAKSIVADILKIIVKMYMLKMVEQTINAFNGTGGSSYSGLANVGMSDNGFAKGGVMTGNGAVSLKRYARGGVAYRPQLAMYGEGSQPEAFVPLPDGRNIPVKLDAEQKPASNNVQVNVINESGQPVEAENRGGRFDGERYVVDVILKAASRPGPLRDALRNPR